jgi:excisionase family DNA binding protein
MNLLTATEVADMLRVSRARVYDLVRRNLIPSVQIGQRQVRFEEEALNYWIAGGGSIQANITRLQQQRSDHNC